MDQLSKDPPQTSALYIHIPFCEKRCSYCDFYTVANRNEAIPEYIAALQTEMALYAKNDFWQAQRVSTIYFGGGTPSLLKPEQIKSLLATAHRLFTIERDVEVTLEANPGTVDEAMLMGYYQAGVNRLSLGVQSFWDDELRQVDRLHNATDIYETVHLARKTGFCNLSIDLIFALPGQRPSRWRHNLEQAVALAPEHISAYNLTIEDGTPLFRLLKAGKVRQLSEWKARCVFNFTIDYLQSHGYEQYEVSNYAKPGFSSQHNYKYWDGSPYLGLGASAHSFDGKRRFWNIDNYVHYIRKLQNCLQAVSGEEILTESQKRFETIFLGLRRISGLDLLQYYQAFGRNFLDEFRAQIDRLTGHAPPLIEMENNHLHLTRNGLLLCDTVCAAFFK
ncbi:MAG: radical SAM family heme chaperone HemW [bacterium]